MGRERHCGASITVCRGGSKIRAARRKPRMLLWSNLMVYVPCIRVPIIWAVSYLLPIHILPLSCSPSTSSHPSRRFGDSFQHSLLKSCLPNFYIYTFSFFHSFFLFSSYQRFFCFSIAVHLHVRNGTFTYHRNRAFHTFGRLVPSFLLGFLLFLSFSFALYRVSGIDLVERQCLFFSFRGNKATWLNPSSCSVQSVGFLSWPRRLPF